jgi:tetratricopeptide (TPR) repeat protein
MVHYKRQRGAILQQKPQMTQYLKKLNNDDTETALSVFTTWELSFQQLQTSGLSGGLEADVLTLLAFFDCKDISEQLFKTFCSSLKMQKIDTNGPGKGLYLFLSQKQRWDVDRYENVVVDLAQISLLQGWFRGSDGFCHVSLHPLVKDWILLRTDIDSFWKFYVIAAAMVAEVLSTSYDYNDFDLLLPVEQALLSHIDIYLEHGEFLKSEGELLLRDKYSELQDSEFWFANMLNQSDRFKEAEIISSRSFKWREKVLGPEHEMTLQSLFVVADLLANANRKYEAVEVDRRLVSSCEKTLGANDQRTFRAHMQLCAHLLPMGELEEVNTILKIHQLRTENVFGLESRENVEILLGQGTYFMIVKEYSEARKALQQARDIEQKLFGVGHARVIATHTLLLLSVELERKHHDAGTLLQELSSAQKKETSGSEQLESVNSELSQIAFGFCVDERYGEAEAIYRDLIERKQHSFSSFEDANILFYFGMVLMQVKKYEEATEMLQSALLIEEKLRGPEHRKTVEVLRTIVAALDLQSKDDQVEEYLGRLIDIKDKQLASHQPEAFNTLTTLSFLFQYLGNEGGSKPKAVRQKMYKRLEETLRCVIEIKEQELGPDHPDILVNIQRLAQVLSWQDKLADAEVVRRKVVEIRSKHSGPDHQETIYAWFNLGDVLEAQEKYPEAEECFKRCCEAEVRRGEGDKKLESRRRLMKVLIAQGKYAEASAIFEEFKGLDDVATCKVMFAFGESLFKQERYQEAQDWFQRGYEAGVRRGEGDSGLESQARIGRCLFRQKNYADALKIYEDVAKKRETKLGPAHAWTISISLAVANTLAHLGRYEDAVEVLRRVIKSEEDILGPESPKLLQSLESLGDHLIMVEDYQGSADVYQRLIQLADKILGPEDKRTVAFRQTLGDGPSSLAAIPVETLLVKSYPEYT